MYDFGEASRNSLVVLPCLDCEAWQGREVEVLSPLGVSAVLGKSAPNPPLGVVALATGRPLKLLKYAATHCFWRLGMSVMSRVAHKLLHLEGAPSALPELLFEVLQKVWSCGKQEAVRLMQLRAMTVEDIEEDREVLDSEQLADALTKSDMQDVQTYVHEITKTAEEQEAIAQKVKEMKAGLVKMKRKPVQMPSAVPIDPSDFAALCPPSGKLYRDTFNGRWLAFFGKGPASVTKSLSWGSRLETTIVPELLKWLWKFRGKCEGEPCWVQGFF